MTTKSLKLRYFENDESLFYENLRIYPNFHELNERGIKINRTRSQRGIGGFLVIRLKITIDDMISYSPEFR